MAGLNHERVVIHQDKGTADDWNADHKQKGNHDCEQHQFLNQVIENRADFPAGPVEGQVVYRTDQHTFYHWNGTIWVALQGPATVVVAADGSGMTTDIQEGIDMLPATGGVVYIKEGIYTISAAIDIKQNNTALIGAGKTTHIVQTAADFIIDCFNFNGLYITNLFLDGNSQTSTVGIRFSTTKDSRVINCWIEECGTDGIYLFVSGENVLIHGNAIKDCNDCGICFVGAVGGIISNNFVDNIGLNLVGASGINLTECHNSIVANNSCSSADPLLSNGILVGLGHHNLITGNQCVGNSANGIFVFGSKNNIFTNNVLLNNSKTAGNTFSGIKLASYYGNHSTHNLIEQNQCNDNQGVGTQRYGVQEVDANQDSNNIIGNCCINNVTANIISNGPNSDVAHNITL